MKTITVFTTTYNRAHTLPFVYESLLRQTSNDFEWLVVDDGSSDETKVLVSEWILLNKITIRYIKQTNMGMVAGHNTAHQNIHTELNVCIDSDDYMPDNGVEIILSEWLENKNDNLMGLVALDSYKSGEIIGTKLPENVKSATFSELLHKHKIRGDKKYVLRTDLIKKHLPYPYIKGEKFPAPSYLYLILEQKYKFLLVNQIICIVEYLPDGNSMNKLKQYKESPNAFAIYRIAKMNFAYNYRDKFRNAVHYIASKFLGNRKNIFRDSSHKITLLFAFPFGVLLYLYIKNTKNVMVNKNLNK
jgi:glycosyltransferase involved in cell wall biosynthesis